MHLAPLIQDLAVILGIAAVVTFLFRLIKQPVVLGYIVAGIIIGPFGLPQIAVAELNDIKVWADLGVIFFMFALGLEFSFRRLLKVGVSGVVTAAVQVTSMSLIGTACARLLHWSGREALFLGCMIAISSTTIIMKTFEEAGLKTRRFAELVFGILIVQDLAAIIMMVALTHIATSAGIDGTDLLIAAAKLGLVVGAWLLVGMFIVPRLVRAVSKRGSSEMLIIVSLGLCLALVWLSAYFNYSVALGAFIMGSILAETKEVGRIEALVAPLKDVFGAIFFVSVGMLLDPAAVAAHYGVVALLCAAVIGGNLVIVTLSCLLTGQSLTTAVQTSFSLAQIGEFSFIIAVLGVSYKAIDAQLYPIIVAVSLLTTFTTPYLVRSSVGVARWLNGAMPPATRQALEAYAAWWQSRGRDRRAKGAVLRQVLRWCANAVIIAALFLVASQQGLPSLEAWLGANLWTRVLAWLATFIIASPFILATISRSSPSRRFPGGLMLRCFATTLLLGAVSGGFFSVRAVAFATVSGAAALLLLFRRHVGKSYQWFERTFVAGIDTPAHHGQTHDHLLPWEAHLAPVNVGYSPLLIGKTLAQVSMRERFGLSVMVIKRGEREIVAPRASERLYPHDTLLCFGTDDELSRFNSALQQADSAATHDTGADMSTFILRPIGLPPACSVVGKTIQAAGIRETYDCLVVGVERGGERFQSPKSDMRLAGRDLLWIVGDVKSLQRLQASLAGPA